MIYLDNAATTRVAPEVVSAMTEVMTEDYGNPSSAHRGGLAADRRLVRAREQLAAALGAAADELVLTSGGTEANVLGVVGAALASRGRHVVATAFEHPSVIEAVRRLGEQGFEITLVKPRRDGCVDAAALAGAVREDTAVVACMLVQNELGTIQPVAELEAALRRAAARPHLHVDAVQALGKIPVDVRALGADTLAVSAHKIHGPKGAGALYVRKGVRLRAFWPASGDALRPGTPNVPGAVGFGVAAELAVRALAGADRLRALRDLLVAAVPGAQPTCAGAPSVPSIASLCFEGPRAEPLLHAAEARGVLVSAGAACASRHKKNHVLEAIGLPDRLAVLRVSLSRLTTEEEVERAAAALAAAAGDVKL